MPVLAIARWVLLRLARSAPIAAVCALGLVALPLLAALRPLGSAEAAAAAARAWAHPAGVIGAAAALVTLSRSEAFLARIDPLTRLSGELVAVLTAAVYLQLPILAGGVAFGGLSAGGLARSGPAILSADLTLASVALLALLPARSTALRASLFLAATVLLPALAAGVPGLARVAGLADPGGALRDPAPATLLAALAASVSLALVAYLVRTGAARAVA